MGLFYYYNAKVIKLLISILFVINASFISVAQEEGGDPIKEAIEEQKQEEHIGSKLNPKEKEELQRIYAKYQLTEKELELRSKQRSGQKIGFIDKFRIGKANRKDYVRKKKLDKFREKKVLSRQSPEVRKRMKENKIRKKRAYKRTKRKQKRKSFLNLFR